MQHENFGAQHNFDFRETCQSGLWHINDSEVAITSLQLTNTNFQHCRANTIRMILTSSPHCPDADKTWGTP